MRSNRDRQLLLGVMALVGIGAAPATTAPALPAVGTKWKGQLTPTVGQTLSMSGRVSASDAGTLTLSMSGQGGLTADWTLTARGPAFVLAGVTVTRGDLRLTRVNGTARVSETEIDIAFDWHQSKGKVLNLPVRGQVQLHREQSARAKGKPAE